MSVHLMKDEEVIWESFQGKNYRIFHLLKDTLFLIMVLLVLRFFADKVITVPTGKYILFLFLIGIIYITIKQIQMLLIKYVITNDRVIIRRGWLNVKLTSISLVNILDTKVEQSFWERLIKTGTVYLFTANDSQNNDDNFIQNVPKIANIDDPFKRHSKIAEIIKESKRK